MKDHPIIEYLLKDPSVKYAPKKEHPKQDAPKKGVRSLSAFTLIVTFVCLSLIGWAFLPLLPVKLAPSHNLPGLTVSFQMPGHSSRVVEAEVTSKLEGIMARVKGIRKVNSTSSNGSGTVTLELDRHADLDAIRFEVSTLVRQVWPQLPQGVSYPLVSMRRSDEKAARPFLTYTLNAPANPILIQQYAEEHIRPVLGQLKGVYRVELNGATPMEWQLEYDSDQLDQLGISLSAVQTAIAQHHEQEFLGLCEVERGAAGSGASGAFSAAEASCVSGAFGVSGASRRDEKKEVIRLVRTSAGCETKFRPAEIPVPTADGTVVPLDKLVRVHHVEEAPSSYFRINGLNSIYLYITAEETANQLQLRAQVKQKMEELKPKMPAGYEVHVSYDATEYIQQELDKIYFRTGLTILILLLFVALLTRNLRYLFLIVLSLTVNLSVAVIFYYLLGLELQLYSLAGITISLNLVIDNTIVMADHLRHRHNLKAFSSVLAATLTTIGALAIIFFLDEKIRLNLQDFAAVVIVNLAVSLFVALFFVPSVMQKIGLLRPAPRKTSVPNQSSASSQAGASSLRNGLVPGVDNGAVSERASAPEGENAPSSGDRNGSAGVQMGRLRRWAVRFTWGYRVLITLLCRYRGWACLVLLLSFGLPVFLLPEKLEGEGKGAELYNQLFDNPTYREEVKPVVEKALGGTLRLFVDKVYEGSYFNRDAGEVVLTVNANLPNGSTLDQMNVLVKKLETYLSEFPEIKQFQTRIYSARQASVQIFFKREHQHSGFPYVLKSNIVSKVLQLGGGSWGVYGLQDQGFSNDVRESAGSFRVKMYGYNYDELMHWGEELKQVLLSHRRIKEVTMNSEFSWWKDDYTEYYLQLNREHMAQAQVPPGQLYAALRPVFGHDLYGGTVQADGQLENLKLSSAQGKRYDLWSLAHLPLVINGRSYRLSDLAQVCKGQLPQQVAKEDQQYRLCLQYEYIGSSEQGRKLLEKDLKAFNRRLPMGYVAESDSNYWRWGEKDRQQYALLFLVIAILFFLTSILFNSLKQPLAILLVIPVSYIGVFLTFYLFGLNFDQGGFASFVLLCGITVNASIYILNEFNALRRRFPRLSPLVAYTKAWNAKIQPISLTILSTILGFIPFLLGESKEAFWFPLAAGTIGGLVLSVVGLFFYLPLFTLKKPRRVQSPSGGNGQSLSEGKVQSPSKGIGKKFRRFFFSFSKEVRTFVSRIRCSAPPPERNIGKRKSM